MIKRHTLTTVFFLLLAFIILSGCSETNVTYEPDPEVSMCIEKALKKDKKPKPSPELDDVDCY